MNDLQDRPPKLCELCQWAKEHLGAGSIPTEGLTLERAAALIRALKEHQADLEQENEALRGQLQEMQELAAPRTTDITAGQEAQAALEESEARYRSLVELSPDAILVHVRGRYVFANQAALKLFGADNSEDIIGHRVLELVHPDSVKTVRQPVIAGERLDLREVKILRLDGRTVEVEVAATPFTYYGQPAIQAVVRDITERQETLREIRRLASFPQLNPNPVLEVDEDGRVLYANPAARQIASSLGLPGGPRAFLPQDFREWFARSRQSGPREYTFDLALKERVYTIYLSFPHDLPTARLYALDITARQDAEEALRTSERRFRQLVESLPQLVWTCLPEGPCDFLSRQWLEYTGVPEAEQQGYGWLNQIHPDDRAGLMEAWEASVATGAGFNVEFRIRRHDGVYRWFDTRALPWRDQDGAIVKWFGSNTDIDAQRELREALRESREDLNRAQAVAHTGSWRMDVQKNELTWSEENHRIFGIPPGTPMTYETFLNTVHPEDREYVDRKWMAALEGESYDIEHRLVVDGAVKWVRERAELEFDQEGNLLGGFGTTQDITERKQGEEALRESEERYRSLFENNHAVMLLIDPDAGIIIDANPAACGYYGYSRDSLVGRSITDINTLDRKLIFQEMEKARAEERKHFEFKHRLASGVIRDVELFSGPIRISDRELLYSIVHDVTARKEAEEALRQSEEHYRSLFNNMLNGFAYCQMHFEDKRPVDFTYLSVNHAFETLTGLKDVVGKKVSVVIPGIQKSDPKLFEIYGRVALTGVPERFEIFLEALAEWFSISVYSPRPEYFVAIFEVITERKRGEEALLRAHDELEERVAERTAAHRLANEQLLWEIEERQQAEDRLRESEARFSAFMEHLPGLAVMRDMEGRYLFANRAWEETMGLTSESWRGKTLAELWAPDQTAFLQKLDHKIISSGKHLEQVEMAELPNGPHHFLTHRFPILDREGLPYMVGSIAIDITARQRAEEALAEHAAQVYDLYNNAPCGYHSLDPEGYFVEINDTELAWLGYSRGEVVGRLKFTDLITPEGRKNFYDSFPGFKERGWVKDLEYAMVRKDGTVFPVVLSATAITDQSGNFLMGRTTTHDITDRKKAEEALKQKEAMLRLILDTLPVGVWLADREGHIVQSNPAARRIWEGARYVGVEDYGEYQGWWADTGKKIEAEEWALARAVSKGETSLGEVINIQCFDGTRKTIINSGVPLFGDNQEILGAIVVNQDITYMVRAEEIIREQARQLEAFFAHGLDPFVFLDPQFNFLRVNEAYARACQRPTKDFIGHNHFELYPNTENQAIFEEVVRTKTPFQIQAKPFEFPDHPEWGVTYWDWSLIPILDQAGEVDFLVFSLRDVTRRVLSEQARSRLIQILEATPDFVGIADYSGQLQYLNRAGRALVGVGEDEDVSRLKVLNLHPREIGEVILEKGAPTAIKEGVWQAELTLLHRDGRKIPVSQVVLAHQDSRGRVQFFSTIARDISNMKAAQANILRQTAIVNGINRIFLETLTCETAADLGKTCLAIAEALTDSKFGFIDTLNEEGNLDPLAFSDPGWEFCSLAPARDPVHLKNLRPVGLLSRPIREGRAVIANDPASHPDAAGTPAGHPPLTAYLGIPLMSGGKPLGLLGLGNKEGGYTLADKEAVESLAPAIVEALMHHRAEEALRGSERKLRYLADQLLTAQENERKRLAAELHDELGHALLALKLQLSSIEKRLLPEQVDIKKEIRSQLDYIHEVIQEVRRLYHDLSPGDVEDLGLTKALRTLIEDFADHVPEITWKVDLADLAGLFSLPVQTIIYRIMQEALTNIGKHANCTEVTIRSIKENGQVHFVVQDNGAGFDAQALGSRDAGLGLGLVAMEERLNMIGGSFEIQSREQAGTRLSFRIPTLLPGERP